MTHLCDGSQLCRVMSPPVNESSGGAFSLCVRLFLSELHGSVSGGVNDSCASNVSGSLLRKLWLEASVALPWLSVQSPVRLGNQGRIGEAFNDAGDHNDCACACLSSQELLLTIGCHSP